MAKKEDTAAASIDPTDIWGRVPPEEKFELMAKAQARGVGAALVVVVIGCTLAVGFKFEWLMWGALLVSPLLFQFVAGKAWRDLRPPIMLEYLAARSATRRFAFANKSQDLFLQLIFRAQVEKLPDDDGLTPPSAVARGEKVDVWAALFNDCIVAIKEDFGGATCVFAYILDDRLSLRGDSPESGDEYANDRVVVLTHDSKKGSVTRYRVTSRYPAALVVFEKKALNAKDAVKSKSSALVSAAVAPEPVAAQDDFLSASSWDN